MPAGPEIDAVFTWVDGAQLPELGAWRTRLAGRLAPGDVGANRWRDNGELRYALRALALHAPWIRRVHLVTSRELPAWLDRSVPELHVVFHAELFPDPSVLPTFNSTAIVAVLHRIPGLARHYLFFNDDLFLGRPITPADFLTDGGGTIFYVEPWAVPASLNAPNVVDRQLAFSRLLLAPIAPRMLAHAPVLFDRERVEVVAERYAPHLRRTVTHRFRATDDALLRFIYANVLIAEGPPHLTIENHGETPLVRVGWEKDIHRTLADLGARTPLSFCLNDDVDDLERDSWMWDAVRSFLADRFPSPSRFESAATGTAPSGPLPPP